VVNKHVRHKISASVDRGLSGDSSTDRGARAPISASGNFVVSYQDPDWVVEIFLNKVIQGLTRFVSYRIDLEGLPGSTWAVSL
jgi:hypothetical protein